MPIRPSPEPARNRAEKWAKSDEYDSRRSGTAKAEERRAKESARRLEEKYGLKRKGR